MINELENNSLYGNTLVSRQIFENTVELAKYVKTEETSDIFKNEHLSSKEPKEDGFNDFESLEDAIYSLEYGTDKYENVFKDNIKKVQNFINQKMKYAKSNYKNDQVGFLPIVPKVLQNNPINMINQNIKNKPFPVAKIIMEKTNCGDVEVDDIVSFYSIIFVLIQILENKGIRCELWVATTSFKSNEVIGMKVKLKSYTQPLNIYKIQFPIISADFHRRIFFRVKETNKDVKNKSWTFGYGHPLLREVQYNTDYGKKKIEEIMKIEQNDIFVPSCEWFNYDKDNNLDKSIKDILEKTNFGKYIKFE